MPALALVALPLLWLLVRAPLASLLISFTVVASVLGSALIVMWCGRPSTRGEFKARGKGGFMSNLFEMLSALSWGGLAFALLVLSGGGAVPDLILLAAVIAFGTGISVLGAAWLLRRRRA
jgi:ABC-2 type transport system permease protein